MVQPYAHWSTLLSAVHSVFRMKDFVILGILDAFAVSKM
jgi:hypothetical protein